MTCRFGGRSLGYALSNGRRSEMGVLWIVIVVLLLLALFGGFGYRRYY
jgi:hypothetical protein